MRANRGVVRANRGVVRANRGVVRADLSVVRAVSSGELHSKAPGARVLTLIVARAAIPFHSGHKSPSLMKRFFLPFLGALMLMPLCGCNVIAQRVARDLAQQVKSSRKTVVAKAAPSAPVALNVAYLKSLAPLPSGEGLLVLEPKADAALQSQANWGAGAARWMQVQIGGAPQLGKTPLWGIAEDARLQLKLPDFRLSGAGADKLGQSIGVTRVATGVLRGAPAKAALVYELRDVQSGKVVGRAQISGDVATLNAQLPALARQLAALMRVQTAAKTLALTADDLKFLGTPALKPAYGQSMSAPDAKRLQSLVAKDALAGVMAQRWTNYADDKSWQAVADTMIKLAPRNALVWAEISGLGAIRVLNHGAQLKGLQKQFPNNYLLARAGLALEAGNRARAQQVKWAETAARAAPGNPFVWCDLADALWEQSNALRRGRYSNAIAFGERRQLNAFYSKAEAAATQATRVDAGYAYGWSRLAQMATFNDDDGVANAALDKSIALDPNNGDAWSWGLQMTQPKWGGDGQEFVTFAKRAAAHADTFRFPANDVSSALSGLGQRGDLKPILEIATAKDPRNVEVLTELGGFYHYEERAYRKAEKLYRQALAIDPNYGRALSQLGDLTYWVHNDPAGAEALYRGAIAADPTDGYFHANLGRMYALTGRRAAAVAQANLAKGCGFSDANHPIWNATGVSPP